MTFWLREVRMLPSLSTRSAGGKFVLTIANRYDTIDEVAPFQLPGATLYAAKDRRAQEGRPNECTVKLYDLSLPDPLVMKYYSSSFHRESESLRRLATHATRIASIVRYRDGGIGQVTDGSKSDKKLFVVWESTREIESGKSVMLSFRDGMKRIQRKKPQSWPDIFF